MALPTDTTALSDYYDDLLFTSAYLSGTKGLAPPGKRVLDARKKVQAAATARNEKTDELVLSNVAQSIAWDAVAEPLESFARQVDAHFDKDRAAYAAVFPHTPKTLLRASEGVRATAFAPVLAFAKKTGLPGKLGQTAKELLGIWSEYLAAAQAATDAAKALTAAVLAVSVTKHQGVVVMRETEGTLRTKYADDPKQWRRFFRANKAKAAVVAPAPPAGPPAPAGASASSK